MDKNKRGISQTLPVVFYMLELGIISIAVYSLYLIFHIAIASVLIGLYLMKEPTIRLFRVRARVALERRLREYYGRT